MVKHKKYEFLGKFLLPIENEYGKDRIEHWKGVVREIKDYEEDKSIPYFFQDEYLPWFDENIGSNFPLYVSLGLDEERMLGLKRLFLIYLLKKTLGELNNQR